MIGTLLLIGFLALIIYNLYKFYQFKTCTPNFNDKVVLITGGSSGIGEQMAKKFIELGASKVIIAARGLKELARVKSECRNPDKVEIL